MNVQTKRWARPLALFIALTMVMMYSFGGVAFATINDVQVKYPQGSNTDYFIVTTTIDGNTYVSTANHTNGANYEGNFSPSLPDGFKSKLDKTNTTILLNGTTQMSINNISASGSDQGDNSINITLDGPLVINPVYDLSINKTVDGSESANVAIDEVATFSILVTNNGPDEAKSVKVQDVLPAGLVIGDITVGKGTYSTVSGIWNIGSLTKDESATLTINVSSPDVAEYVNTAEIKFSPNYDTNTTNDRDNASLSVYNPVNPPESEYDLVINKDANLNSVTKNSIVTFTVTAKNAGNTTITGVTVADIWTDGLTELELISQSGISFDKTTGVWNVGSIGPNNLDTKTLVITAKASKVGTATNTAIGYLAETETGQEPNSDSEVIQINDSVVPPLKTYDLVVNKTADRYTATKGSIVTFTITAQNAGNTTITGVTVDDDWTNGLTDLTVVSQNGNTFSTATGIWDVGVIGPNNVDIKTLVITAKASSVGAATNTAIGTLVETETGQGANTDSVGIEITESTSPPTPKNDLAVTKSANLSSVTVGTGVVFTIVIKNTGDTTLQSIQVNDTWPSGLTLGTAAPDAGTNFTTNGNIWMVGTLAPNESKTLTIAAGTPTAGTYTNNVGIFKSGEVPSPLVDDNLTNNTAAAIVTVTNPTNPGGGGGGGGGGTGGGGGGTTTIPETTPPLTNIPETETPLVEAPEVTLEEQPIPLADVPQTGDNTNIWLLLALMMGSGAGIVLLGRRKEAVEK